MNLKQWVKVWSACLIFSIAGCLSNGGGVSAESKADQQYHQDADTSSEVWKYRTMTIYDVDAIIDGEWQGLHLDADGHDNTLFYLDGIYRDSLEINTKYHLMKILYGADSYGGNKYCWIDDDCNYGIQFVPYETDGKYLRTDSALFEYKNSKNENISNWIPFNHLFEIAIDPDSSDKYGKYIRATRYDLLCTLSIENDIYSTCKISYNTEISFNENGSYTKVTTTKYDEFSTDRKEKKGSFVIDADKISMDNQEYISFVIKGKMLYLEESSVGYLDRDAYLKYYAK